MQLEVANASGCQLDAGATVADVARLAFSRVNPVTGPVCVRGAEPGDALVVEVLAIDLDTWGWAANIPRFGLLRERFTQPHLRIAGETARRVDLVPGLGIPVVPFIGTIGVALAAEGEHGHPADAPGARLFLPVAVPGALLSLGETGPAAPGPPARRPGRQRGRRGGGRANGRSSGVRIFIDKEPSACSRWVMPSPPTRCATGTSPRSSSGPTA